MSHRTHFVKGKPDSFWREYDGNRQHLFTDSTTCLKCGYEWTRGQKPDAWWLCRCWKMRLPKRDKEK